MPLHHACLHSHTGVADVLIRAGANVRGGNKFGATPLNVSAASGHLSTVRLLLSAGVQISEENVAQFSNCPRPVLMAALFLRNTILRALLEKQPNRVNDTTKHAHWTPLMLAAAGGHKPTAELLIDRGADPNKLTALDATLVGNAREVWAFLDTHSSVRNRAFDTRLAI